MCLATLAQIILFALNVGIWAAGFCILLVGLWAYWTGDPIAYMSIVNEADDLWDSALIFFIVLGGFMFFVGYLGCSGAWNEHGLMLKLYSLIIGVLILCEVIIVILAAVFWGEIEDKLAEAMRNQIRDEYVDEIARDETSQAWNKLMFENNCCGADNFLDFQNSLYTNTTNRPVPWVCCQGKFRTDGDVYRIDPPEYGVCRDEARDASPTYPEGDEEFTELNPIGCLTSLLDWVDDRALFLILVAVGIVVLEALCIVMACLVIKNRKG